MIVFDLECRSGGHRFEGWFGSSGDFSQQQERGLVTCPVCGGGDVIKAVMAPNLGRKGNQLSVSTPLSPQEPTRSPAAASAPVTNAPVTNAGPVIPPEALAMFRAIAEAQTEALKSSRWVGDTFAETARAIHYGEADAEPIHGKATHRQAQELVEEGIEIAPVLVSVVPPGKTN